MAGKSLGLTVAEVFQVPSTQPYAERRSPKRISQGTWDTLITLGFVEEWRDGPSSRRFLRLTEKGRRAVDDGRY